MPQSPYDEMVLYNEFLKEKFILHGADNSTLTLLNPSRAIAFPKDSILPSFGELGQVGTPSVLEKKTIYSNTKTKAKISVINQEGQYQTTVYVTTPEKIRQALRNGVFEPANIQDPLAKMIAQIAEYKRKVFQRSTELQVKVRKNEERLAVADITQAVIETLQPLNRYINHYEAVKSPVENLEKIVTEIDHLTGELEKIIGEIPGKKEEPYLSLLNCIYSIKHNAKQYKKSLEAIQNPTEEQVRAILGSYGVNDNLLKYFIQGQLNEMTQGAIDANYALTGLYQDASGLSQALLNAQFTGEGYSSQFSDYHNAVSSEHGFDFSAKEKNGLVAIDLGQYGFHPKSNVDLAKRIALIQQLEEGKKLYKETDATVTLINFRGEKDKIAGYTAAKKLGFLLVNFGIDIISFGLDLLYSGFFIAATATNVALQALNRKLFRIPDFPSEQLFLQKWNTEESVYEDLDSTKALFGENAITRVTHRGLFVRTMQFINRQLINLSLKPLGEAIKGVTTHFWDGAKTIFYDLTIGIKPISDNEIIGLLNSRLEEERRIAHHHQQAISNLLQTHGIEPYQSTPEVLNEGEAKTDYSLHLDNPEDFVSWATNDFARSMTEIFSKEIYRAHPIGGVAFTLAACTTAPMVMPFLAKLSFFHFLYTKLHIPIAKTLVGETHGLMPTFSTAMIEGKAAFLLADLTNGKNSITVRGIEILMENPVLAGIMGTAAVGLGFEIAFKANIPWLSNEIATEVEHASFPYFELGVSAAKLATIVVESGIRFPHKNTDPELIEEESDEQSQIAYHRMDELRPEIKAAITIGYKRVSNLDQLTEEEEKQIEIQTEQYLDAFKGALKSDYSDFMVNSLEKAIATYVAKGTGAPASEKSNSTIVSKFQENFKRERIRQHVLQLDFENLSPIEKYQLMHYVNTHYANNPEYLAAVRYKLMGSDEKIGGLAGSIKIVLSYIPAGIRALVAVVASAGFAIGSLINPKLLEPARLALQPAQDLINKARADMGLLAKASTTLLRISWELIGAVVRVPLILLYSIGASPILIGQYLTSSSHYLPTPLEMDSLLSRLLFAPGKISQVFNAVVGFFRAEASAKHLEAATREATLKEMSENINEIQSLLPKKIETQTHYSELLTRLLTPAPDPVKSVPTISAFPQTKSSQTEQSPTSVRSTLFSNSETNGGSTTKDRELVRVPVNKHPLS
ncbi:hypothetical protein [Legionella maceachernii]|uniref:Uncharacterized protein n=2 Tax=Legionella maceachernii TaxID=466 RepID=A0A0W0W0N0_9GAMM|nr:hypothetical protein [Legionella maceachernii]KTD25801.1 hypothetical protein Lmac_1572 [Legionella maceachernii]SJZ45855.1 hypothetical protein SAMN02745128_00076 [Legionella maceachernii]SUP04052.1 Uncharacterised protein [Legionella maceachernii]